MHDRVFKVSENIDFPIFEDYQEHSVESTNNNSNPMKGHSMTN